MLGRDISMNSYTYAIRYYVSKTGIGTRTGRSLLIYFAIILKSLEVGSIADIVWFSSMDTMLTLWGSKFLTLFTNDYEV